MDRTLMDEDLDVLKQLMVAFVCESLDLVHPFVESLPGGADLDFRSVLSFLDRTNQLFDSIRGRKALRLVDLVNHRSLF